MSPIIKNLYLGDIDNAGDERLLSRHGITHVLSGIEYAHWLPEEVKANGRQHLCFEFFDVPESNIRQYFKQSIEFIHKGRQGDEGVLVHWYVLLLLLIK